MRLNRDKIIVFLLDNLIWVLLTIAVVTFALLSDRFLTSKNLVNILVHSSVLGIMVIGQSFCQLSGNFDLSAESILGLAAILGAFVIAPAGAPFFGSGLQLNPILTVLIMFVLGILVGWINGFLVTRMKMNNFIVTLAMLIIIRGLTLVFSEGKTITGIPQGFKALGHESLGPLPISVIVLLIAFAVAFVITRYTRFGRDLYAIGGNRDAALASGIDPNRRIRQVYLISGLMAAFAAWMELGRLGVGATRIGEGMIFEIQAAAVIGGISLFGGRGNMIGALGGVLLLSTFNSGLNLMMVSGFWIDMIRGIIILLAMLIDAQKTRYKAPVTSQAAVVASESQGL